MMNSMFMCLNCDFLEEKLNELSKQFINFFVHNYICCENCVNSPLFIFTA